MRSVAIIGAGQAGLLTAHDLLRHGYRVTLFSDKTPAAFLRASRPTGTAARFAMSLDYERELGLDFWNEQAPRVEGVHLTFCQSRSRPLIELVGRFSRHGLAIDLRLQSHRWMTELSRRGGAIEIENVSLDRLDDIAGAHDLTIIAAGRRSLRGLFARDDARSRHTSPQRHLCMVNTRGQPPGFDDIPLRPVKFNFFAEYGEAFWVPWYHKDHGPSWSLLIEARPGGPLDRFVGIDDGHHAVEVARQVIRDIVPWDYEWCKDMELLDDNAWLVGAFTPEVRESVATLPSGRKVMAVGDTAMSLDPIGGQGANNGNKMARCLVASIVERADRPYDERWMRGTFERFWRRHRAINAFNDLLLEPLTRPGRELLIAQYGSDGRTDNHSGPQKLANLLCENFNDPALITEAFFDMDRMRGLIASVTGKHWRWSVARGRAAIARDQARARVFGP